MRRSTSGNRMAARVNAANSARVGAVQTAAARRSRRSDRVVIVGLSCLRPILGEYLVTFGSWIPVTRTVLV